MGQEGEGFKIIAAIIIMGFALIALLILSGRVGDAYSFVSRMLASIVAGFFG